MSTTTYYVAVYGGFLVYETYDAPDQPHGVLQKVYTVADSRLATPFSTFKAADALAKWAVGRLYPPDLRYFAVLIPAIGLGVDPDRAPIHQEQP